jgi:uncharacterized membrane protein HdeD (DUF308 family)
MDHQNYLAKGEGKMTTAVAQQSSYPGGVPWWLVLIEGIALVILGLLMVVSPGMTTLILVQFVGIYWLVAGIFKIVSIFLDSSGWGWKLVGGIIGILAGLIVIQHPIWSPFVIGSVLVVILGVQGLIIGVVGLIQGFQGGGWGAAVLGVISILFGLLFLFNVWGFTLALPWAIGIMALIGGVIAIIGAFRLKSGT